MFIFSFLAGCQLRNKLNQDQNSKLQQQRENLNKRNLEIVSMDKRISELRDRLWKKKAALQQKENLPVSIIIIMPQAIDKLWIIIFLECHHFLHKMLLIISYITY